MNERPHCNATQPQKTATQRNATQPPADHCESSLRVMVLMVVEGVLVQIKMEKNRVIMMKLILVNERLWVIMVAGE